MDAISVWYRNYTIYGVINEKILAQTFEWMSIFPSIVVVVTLKDLPNLHSPVDGHLMRTSSVVTG